MSDEKIGSNEIERLRDEMLDIMSRVSPGLAVSKDMAGLRHAIHEATYGWMAYRVRTHENNKLIERWQIRAPWRVVGAELSTPIMRGQ